MTGPLAVQQGNAYMVRDKKVDASCFPMECTPGGALLLLVLLHFAVNAGTI
jgi:hypothetical protein